MRVDHILFSSAGRLGYPHLLPLVNGAALYTCAHVFARTGVFLSLGSIPRSGIAGNSVFSQFGLFLNQYGEGRGWQGLYMSFKSYVLFSPEHQSLFIFLYFLIISPECPCVCFSDSIYISTLYALSIF